MNNFGLYSIRDRVAGSFRSVTLDTNDGTAKRNFTYALNNSPEMLFTARDLELCRLAEFDPASGSIVPCIPLVVVCRGDEVITDAEKK